jgi:hypothetical protein
MLPLTARYLLLEAEKRRGTGGISAENKGLGFRPAFLDTNTGEVYVSQFADGRAAPFHLLEGLPDHLAIARDKRGYISQVVGSVIAGFLRNGVFYTRDQAAAAVADDDLTQCDEDALDPV